MNEKNGWLVVMTKPKMEIEAKAHLVRQGFEVYLPLWIDLRRRAGGWQRVQSAMFPRYLFVRLGYAEQSVTPIRSTRGVSQLVHFGMEPAWANEAMIDDIRTLEATRSNSNNQLKSFKKGDHVLIMEGPFQGVSAEVFSSDQQRVILLLQVLGKNQMVEFEARFCQVR
jgi:transcriptional antiterminator RfaH